jgi:hypothetical protein
MFDFFRAKTTKIGIEEKGKVLQGSGFWCEEKGEVQHPDM